MERDKEYSSGVVWRVPESSQGHIPDSFWSRISLTESVSTKTGVVNHLRLAPLLDRPTKVKFHRSSTTFYRIAEMQTKLVVACSKMSFILGKDSQATQKGWVKVRVPPVPLELTKLLSNFFILTSSKRSKARCHCKPDAQALTAAL